jgi:hypothetical protein
MKNKSLGRLLKTIGRRRGTASLLGGFHIGQIFGIRESLHEALRPRAHIRPLSPRTVPQVPAAELPANNNSIPAAGLATLLRLFIASSVHNNSSAGDIIEQRGEQRLCHRNLTSSRC